MYKLLPVCQVTSEPIQDFPPKSIKLQFLVVYYDQWYQKHWTGPETLPLLTLLDTGIVI